MPNEKNNLPNALRQLETIVDDLSNKDVDVEAGLAKFKTGVELIKFCRGQLKQAENEFQKLKAELEVEDAHEELPLEENDEEILPAKTSKQKDIDPEDIPF